MRLIAKIEIKNDSVVKGLQFEGVRKICPPEEGLQRLVDKGCEEIFLVDNTKSVFGLPPNFSVLEKLAAHAILPITFGGGIANLEQALKSFELGASRIYINSATFTNPNLIKEISNICGKQALTGGVEYRRIDKDRLCFGAAGREKSRHHVSSRIDMLLEQGVGEILLSSIDNDGSQQGFDWDILETLPKTPVPILIAGGGTAAEFSEYQSVEGLEGLAFSSVVLGL